MTYRQKALALLVDRRRFDRHGAEWRWRTKAAWKYLQMHLGKPASKWTDTPPNTTIGN